MKRSVTGLLQHAREKYADKTALRSGTSTLTFAELHRAAHRGAAALAARGVAPGDRVAVCLRPGLDQAVALLAACCAEAVAMPVLSRLRPAAIAYTLADAEAAVLVTEEARVAELAQARTGTVVISPEQLRAAAPRQVRPGPSVQEGDELALLLYTSGSTGRPKGIMVTHENVVAGAEIVSGYLGTTSEDRIGGLLTLNFDYGLNQLWQCLLTGAELHLHEFVMPRTAFSMLASGGITALPLMPALVDRLFSARGGGVPPGVDLSAVRYVTTSGGAVSHWALDRLREAFPRAELFLMYGLTEAFRSSFLHPSERTRQPASVGRAMPGVELYVLDAEGRRECAPGETGVVVHRGACVTKGYWRSPERTERVFRRLDMFPGETVVWSGDLATKDEEGCLYIVGREDFQLKRDGFRISPEDVEATLNDHPAVAQSLVMGLPDGDRGDRLVAAWTSREGYGPGDGPERAWMARRLPEHMMPTELRHWDALPATDSGGKFDRLAALSRFTSGDGALDGTAPAGGEGAAGEGAVDGALPAAAERAVGEGPVGEGAVAAPGGDADAGLIGPVFSRARSEPHRPALRHGSTVTTYGELARLALTIAGAVEASAGPGARVAIEARRTPGTVAAILGVLAAGAAYVPLNPQEPRVRREVILDQAGVRYLIENGTVVPRGTDADAPASPEVPTPGPLPAPRAVRDDAVAYVLSTSGSTGVPKSVPLTQANARAFVEWAEGAFALGPGRRIGVYSPLFFDLSVFDLFAGLRTGAELILVPDEAVRFPRTALQCLRESGAEVLYTVPSALRSLLAAARGEELAGLRQLLLAGEPFPASDLDRIRAVAPDAVLHNLYGPIETNVVSCFTVPSDWKPGEPVPIGRPVPGAVLALLDDAGRIRTDPGAEGELLISGRPVFPGYLPSRPAPPDPFLHRDGRRWYRTDDLAGIGPDGVFRFTGRRGSRVKNHGFLVDLTEVETVLTGHEEVGGAAVVTAGTDGDGPVSMHAFVEPAAGSALDERALRAWCGERLPRYMWPHRFHLLPRLPLGPTGKTDRVRLTGLLKEENT
ncbi:AMP-binding protein [Streptomyces sp. 8N706]|uniref:AMP-binding protein n=1 Tax=Streptomyces sp. 8N706 TaxID=3457416 RepID=UPI003FD08E79